MEKSSLQISDDLAAGVQKTPNRVSLQNILDNISAEYWMTGDKAIGDCPLLDGLETLTIYIIVMKNGHKVVGTSAPADGKNFDADLGRKFAREDAIRQLWPLEGYALRERLAA